MLKRSDYTGASWVFGYVLHESAKRGYNVEKILTSVTDDNVIDMCFSEVDTDTILSYILKKDSSIASSDRKYSMRVSKLAGQFYFILHVFYNVSIEELARYAKFSIFEKNFTVICAFDYIEIWENMKETNCYILGNEDNLDDILKTEENEDYEEEMFE